MFSYLIDYDLKLHYLVRKLMVRFYSSKSKLVAIHWPLFYHGLLPR